MATPLNERAAKGRHLLVSASTPAELTSGTATAPAAAAADDDDNCDDDDNDDAAHCTLLPMLTPGSMGRND